MVSFLDNEGLRHYDERLKVWVEAKVEESSSSSSSNDGNIVMGIADSGMVTLNYSGIQYSKTGQTAKTITWENLFAKLDRITE